MMHEDHTERLAKQQEILGRLDDLISANPMGMVGNLIDVAVAIVAKSHPADLTKANKALIKSNYPPATPALMKERATSEEGLKILLTAANMMMGIGLDYNPITNVEEERNADVGEALDAGERLGMEAMKLFDKAVEGGISEFGATCTLILVAIHHAGTRGVSPYKIARPLHDGLSMAMTGMSETKEQMEERVATFVASQMGISKAEAKRYFKNVRR